MIKFGSVRFISRPSGGSRKTLRIERREELVVKNNILLIVDVQSEFKDLYGYYERCLDFIDTYNDRFDQIFYTEFQNHDGSMFQKHLNYYDCGSSTIEFSSQVQLRSVPIKKTSYGIPSDVLSMLHTEDRIVIVGCELDACILAVCFQLWDKGIDFTILTEYCWTNNADVSRDDIIKLLKRQFGNCIR